MASHRGLYPGYDVLAHKHEWDANTRQIVEKRLGPFSYKLLSSWEQSMLKAVAGHLTYEDRPEVLAWVAAHFDQELGKAIGESQRQPRCLPKRTSRGWAESAGRVGKTAVSEGVSEARCPGPVPDFEDLQLGQLPMVGKWNETLQRALFKKLVSLAVEAYYSHPWVWSEIGYGGPAYPGAMSGLNWGLLIRGKRSEEGALLTRSCDHYGNQRFTHLRQRKYAGQEVDAVVVGLGAAGGLILRDLAKAGWTWWGLRRVRFGIQPRILPAMNCTPAP